DGRRAPLPAHGAGRGDQAGAAVAGRDGGPDLGLGVGRPGRPGAGARMRRRLLAITVAAAALVVVAFVVPLEGLVRSVAHDRAVSGAERDMASLAPALAAGADPTTVASAVTLTSTGADGRLAVWLPDGTRVGDDAPADDAALTLARQRSFSVETDG